MKLKKILIITSSIDYTVDYMISKFSNVNFYRLNVDMLEFYKIRITEDNWEISNDVWKIGSNIIDSIYWHLGEFCVNRNSFQAKYEYQ